MDEAELQRRGYSVRAMREMAHRRLPRMLFDMVDGAAGDEITMRRNEAALAEIAFAPRLLAGAPKRDQSVELFGARLPSPLVATAAFRDAAGRSTVSGNGPNGNGICGDDRGAMTNCAFRARAAVIRLRKGNESGGADKQTNAQIPTCGQGLCEREFEDFRVQRCLPERSERRLVHGRDTRLGPGINKALELKRYLNDIRVRSFIAMGRSIGFATS